MRNIHGLLLLMRMASLIFGDHEFSKNRRIRGRSVIGYYKRKVSFFKIVTSKAWEFLVYLLFGLKIKDIDCGFKLISRKVVEKYQNWNQKEALYLKRISY